MTFLLDVNSLIALLVSAHEHHHRADTWVASLDHADILATCSITEIGFVRVLNQAPQYRVPVRESVRTLERFRTQTKHRVLSLEDRHGASDLPGWVKGARQITDGHLSELAKAHKALLATFDEGIPEGFLIPHIRR